MKEKLALIQTLSKMKNTYSIDMSDDDNSMHLSKDGGPTICTDFHAAAGLSDFLRLCEDANIGASTRDPKQITDEDIEKAATIWFQGRVEGGLKQHFIDGAKWFRDQQPNEDIEKLKAKAFALDNLWFPIVDYAQSHKIEGLKPGDGISDFILKLLEERTI